MFACHCNMPTLPVSTCAVHQQAKRGHVVVNLGHSVVHPVVRATSEDKYDALLDNRCKVCNAAKTGIYGHICTRHPSEPEVHPNPWDR